jgi:hemoglobin
MSMSDERKRVYGELGTAYAKCGGIFGISAFADRCMDRWMADATLNSNEAVATWHAKAQRCGFKFLVVQIIGQLTGGPQRYTGRPMDEAHKHLNISEGEWDVFMEIFNSVCEEFQLPGDLIGDLNALMISMEDECVVHAGERAPPNPGPLHIRGNSLYARCGGVYPIALFVDRLVDALMQDGQTPIPCDGQRRNDVSLKYLLTEVMCSIAGGAEVMTARDFEETMLLLPKAAWEVFIATAQIAADHFPVAVRAEIIQCLQRSQKLIVDPNSSAAGPQTASAGNPRVKSLQAAASGRMLSSAAIAARHAAPGAHVEARRRVIGDPRTLYGRGGGVFGLAKLADSLMDAWMADPALNGNAAVAKWHESQQKFGFKFLVTQLLGYLTGGPQRYTGVSMEAAHKHLAISPAQWGSFIDDATLVFEKLGVDAGTQCELLSILASFEAQCVAKPGEPVPEDPGMCRALPQGNGAYAQLGGVYPLALFADKLVDNVLQDDRLQVQWNNVDDASGTRHPPGLKYVLTELLCHGAGGPELPTSKGFDEAKLGVDPDQWSVFLEIVSEAATVWPTKHHRELILRICEKSKVEICFGLEGQAEVKVEVAEVAGVDAFLATARCPFSGKSGKCPFSGSQPATGSPPSPARNVTVAADHEQMAVVLDEAVQAPMAGRMAGRILGSTLQQKFDKLTEEDPELCCPVSLMVLTNPVLASDGFIYEESSLKQLLENRQVSPMTRECLKQEYRRARNKKSEAIAFRLERTKELLDFAAEAVAEQKQLTLAALRRVEEYVAPLDSDVAHKLAQNAMHLYSKLGLSAPVALRQRAHLD